MVNKRKGSYPAPDGGVVEAGDITVNVEIQEIIDKLCEVLGPNDDGDTALDKLCEISVSTQELCQKILDQGDQNATVITELQALCEKLLETNTSLEALCTKIEEGNAEQLACFEAMKATLAEILAALSVLTDMNASLEQICEKLDTANQSLSAILAAILAQTAILTNIEANQTGQSCDRPTHITSCDPKPTVTECCTGGATDETAQCFNVPIGWFTGSLGNFDRCTWSIGGVDLPDDNYTRADFEAAWPAGTTFEDEGDSVKVCTTEGFAACYRSACFNGAIGQLARVCLVSVPNTTEEVCEDFQRTWGKYEEPIGNILATQLATQEDMLDKLCLISDGDDLGTAKLCLIEDHLNPAGPCPAVVPPEGLDKVAQTLTLKGNVSANYPAGQDINLMDANGQSCGTATAAAAPLPVYDPDTDLTTVSIEECELDEGKEPLQVTQAKPVAALIKTAIKTVKAFALKKTVIKKVNVKG